jgi:hypothetical protein
MRQALKILSEKLIKQHIYLFISVLLLFFSIQSKAQTGYQNITDQRIVYLSSKLSLTAEESQNFWPLFREYHMKRETASVKRKSLNIPSRGLSREESLRIINDYIEVKVQQALLLEEYHKKYLEILPPQKVLELYKYDEEFNQHLLKQIKNAGQRRK